MGLQDAVNNDRGDPIMVLTPAGEAFWLNPKANPSGVTNAPRRLTAWAKMFSYRPTEMRSLVKKFPDHWRLP